MDDVEEMGIKVEHATNSLLILGGEAEYDVVQTYG
jgi:hypothetical protein